MTFISYSQNLEDVVLWRALRHCSPGRYVDVGAQDPLVDSVGRAFHEAGWKGVHVEPLADYAAALRDAFPTDTVIEAALSKEVGSLTFYELPGGGLSTAHSDIAKFHQEHAGHVPIVRQVATTTLAAVFSQMGNGPIHWLKIDVEGHEREVLEGWGDSPERPWVVLVESTFPTTDKPTHDMWEDLLLARDYALIYTDGLNRFYLHDDHRDLHNKFRYPPNVFDDFELNGTATWLTTRLVRQHHEKTSEQQGRIDQLDGFLNQSKRERDEMQAALLSLRRQNQIEQKNHAAELERLRSAGKVSEALERLARDLENEVRTLRAAANDAQAHRLQALEKAEIAQGEARIAHNELAAAQAEASRSLEHARTLSDELVRVQERADNVALELQESRFNADLLTKQVAVRTSRIAQLEGQLRHQSEAIVARSYALNTSLENANQMAAQLDLQAVRIGQLEDQLSQQTDHVLARTYALHRAESEAGAAKAEAAALGKELSHRIATIEQMEKLIVVVSGEIKDLTEKLGGSLWMRLLARLGLMRIDTSRVALVRQQALLAIERLDEQSMQTADGEHEWGRTYMTTTLANDVNELLTVNGAEFVDVAYRTLLKRSPDRAGRDHFLERLRAGHGKEAVILAMADSAEARALPETLPGLDELRARQAKSRGSRGGQVEIQRLERTMNRLEFSLGEMHARTARQSDRILERLDLLENKMAAFSASGVITQAATSAGFDGQQAITASAQSISSLTGQITETAPDQFIDQMRNAVRQSAEAATIAANTH